MIDTYWGWQAQLLPYLELESSFHLLNFEFVDPNLIDYNNCFSASAFLYNNNLPSVSDKQPRTSLCPSDSLAGSVWPNASPALASVYGRHMVSSYFGVSGTKSSAFHLNALGYYDASRDGVLFGAFSWRKPGVYVHDSSRPVRLADVVDGASHTFMAGERGATTSLYWGWAICGDGVSGNAEGDQTLSMQWGVYPDSSDDQGASTRDPLGNAVNNLHFWSCHPGGTNFLYVDGSATFVSYSVAFGTLQALSTRAGGEAVNTF
jgi:prepilin-type processing-associated H-X9-DG protein